MKNYINADTALFIVIKSVSKSGMQRRMQVYNNNGQFLTGYIADLCDLSFNNNGLKIDGCGMDMTFWLADYITRSLWPDKKYPEWAYGGNGQMVCLKYQVL